MIPGRKRKEDDALVRKARLLFSPCNLYSDVSHTVEVKHTIMLSLQSLTSGFLFSHFSRQLSFIYLFKVKKKTNKSLLVDYLL